MHWEVLPWPIVVFNGQGGVTVLGNAMGGATMDIMVVVSMLTMNITVYFIFQNNVVMIW